MLKMRHLFICFELAFAELSGTFSIMEACIASFKSAGLAKKVWPPIWIFFWYFTNE